MTTTLLILLFYADPSYVVLLFFTIVCDRDPSMRVDGKRVIILVKSLVIDSICYVMALSWQVCHALVYIINSVVSEW